MNVNASHVRDRNTAHRRRVRRAAPMIGVLSIALLASACSSGSSGKSLAAPSGHGDMVAYAHCMRSHGVSNFPDPMAGGQVALPTGLDPKSPQYEKAAVACRSIAPNGATQQHFTPPMAQLLQFSECMRSHGITNFPIPATPVASHCRTALARTHRSSSPRRPPARSTSRSRRRRRSRVRAGRPRSGGMSGVCFQSQFSCARRPWQNLADQGMGRDAGE
jgi:hypothetical protein